MIALLVIGTIAIIFILVVIYGLVAAGHPRRLYYRHGTGEGVRILFLSDLHLGRLLKPRKAQKILDQIDIDGVEVVIIGGDLVGSAFLRHYSLAALGRLFSRFDAIPTRLFVRGNHEIKISEAKLGEVLEAIGFKLLVNQVDRSRVAVYGFDELKYGAPLPPTAPVDISVVHQPDHFLSLDYPTLCLSGHSHGGQITFLGLRLYVATDSRHFKAGLYRRGESVLLVSKGLGNNLLPLRLWARPDYYIIDFPLSEREKSK